MNKLKASHQFLRVFGIILITALAAGCSKKSEPPPTAATPQASETPTTAPASAQTAPAQIVNPQSALASANAALSSGQYEQATKTLLAVQAQRNLTDQQAAAAAAQMVQLQRSLAGAVASGDPKAKAAADMLRAAARHE